MLFISPALSSPWFSASSRQTPHRQASASPLRSDVPSSVGIVLRTGPAGLPASGAAWLRAKRSRQRYESSPSSWFSAPLSSSPDGTPSFGPWHTLAFLFQESFPVSLVSKSLPAPKVQPCS